MATTYNNSESANTERGRYLLNRWKNLLDYSTASDSTSADYYKRLSTAITMESEEKWIIKPEVDKSSQE
jgi:hypothetical protein